MISILSKLPFLNTPTSTVAVSFNVKPIFAVCERSNGSGPSLMFLILGPIRSGGGGMVGSQEGNLKEMIAVRQLSGALCR